MAKIYIVQAGQQYEEAWNIRAFRDKNKAQEWAEALDKNQKQEDEAEGVANMIVFYLRELEYEE